jgi:prolyl 4-hydroxylase
VASCISCSLAHFIFSKSRGPLMKRSVVAEEKQVEHQSRTSYSAFLGKSQDDVVQCIEERASKFSSIPPENIEPLQVVWYREGQKYEPHFDYFPPGTPGASQYTERGGQRLITFFVYLNTVPSGAGGETAFPKLDLKVAPIENDAVFWYDVTSNNGEDPRTLHGGSPLGAGEKWGLNIWIRERAFV